MAARTNKPNHDERTKEKIKTSQLVNRLTNHALGKVKLSATQVRAIEILLKKTLPDLSSVQADVNANQNVYAVSDKPMTQDEWTARHAGDKAAVEPAGRPANGAH